MADESSWSAAQLDRPKLRDPVLHETMTAILWVHHAVTALAAGNLELSGRFLDLAKESVFRTLELADTDGGGPE